jgi:hypothetical protein
VERTGRPVSPFALAFQFDLISCRKGKQREIDPRRIDFCSPASTRRTTRACASMDVVRDFKLTIADAQKTFSAFTPIFTWKRKC